MPVVLVVDLCQLAGCLVHVCKLVVVLDELARLVLLRAEERALAVGIRQRPRERDLEHADARAEAREDGRVVAHRLLGLVRGDPAPAHDAVVAQKVALPDLKLEPVLPRVRELLREVEARKERAALDLRLAPLAPVAEFNVAVGLGPPALELGVGRRVADRVAALVRAAHREVRSVDLHEHRVAFDGARRERAPEFGRVHHDRCDGPRHQRHAGRAERDGRGAREATHSREAGERREDRCEWRHASGRVRDRGPGRPRAAAR
mmetsp:Transcript_8735/g.26280  ORF Transcript_8735/g.26280 Transcript_8735/m.26280 type:complete len:262 (+) Transcript_8735:50-835(+)